MGHWCLLLVVVLQLAPPDLDLPAQLAQAAHLVLEVLVLVAEQAQLAQAQRQRVRLWVPRVVVQHRRVRVQRPRREHLHHLQRLVVGGDRHLAEDAVGQPLHAPRVVGARVDQLRVLGVVCRHGAVPMS